MSRIAQALHIARKDVRFTRLALAVYAALVAIALVHLMGFPRAKLAEPGAMAEPMSIGMFVLVLLGVILVASAVQADSPVQNNAFWASRPFDPTAMVGAKLIYGSVVLIGIPLVAQTIGYLRFGASSGAIVASLLKSGTMYGLILLCAAVVAGLTTDLRGFIVGALVLLIGVVLGVAAFMDRPALRIAGRSLTGSLVVAIAIGVGMLLLLYRRRDVGRIAWIGAIAVVAATFLVFEAIEIRNPEVLSSLRSVSLQLEPVVSPEIGAVQASALPDHRARLSVRFTLANLPKSMRVNLQIDSAFLHLGDGSVVRGGRPFNYVASNNSLGALPAGIRRFGAKEEQFAVATDLGFIADSADIASKGMRELDVWAQLSVAEAVPLASTRVGTPLETTSHGTRLRISDDFASGGNVVTMIASTVTDARYFGDPRNVGIAVINEESREGIVLTSSMYSNSSTWMILPGAQVNTSVVLLNTNKADADVTQMPAPMVAGLGSMTERLAARDSRFPEPAWFRNAKVVAMQWIPRGNYPVRVSKTLN